MPVSVSGCSIIGKGRSTISAMNVNGKKAIKLLHTTNDSILTFLNLTEIKLPSPHQMDAPMSKRKPSRVQSIFLWTKITAMPEKEISAPTSCQIDKVCCAKIHAKNIAKKTCTCEINAAMPGETPAAIPANNRENCTANVSSP